MNSSNQNYIVIDPLYISEIDNNLNKFNSQNEVIDFLNNKCFPYSDNAFLNVNVKSIENLKFTENYNLNLVPKDKIIDTDTGILIYIKEEEIIEFSKKFDYNLFIDQFIEKEKDFLKATNEIYSDFDWGVINPANFERSTLGSGSFLLL